MLLHFVNQRLGDVAAVKSVCAFKGNALEDTRQGRVLQTVTDRPRLAIGLKKISRRLRVMLQRSVCAQKCMQAWAEGETFFSQGNSRCKELRPRQGAVLLVGFLQHAQQAGHAHRSAAHHRIVKSHGLVFNQKQALRSLRRRGFAAVKNLQLFAVVVQQKSTPANAAGLRFHQAQHHLHSDGRVHCCATGLQHLVTRVAGQGVGCGHPALFEGPTRFGLVTAGGLG